MDYHEIMAGIETAKRTIQTCDLNIESNQRRKEYWQKELTFLHGKLKGLKGDGRLAADPRTDPA